jgi:hypothetical protein
MSKRRYAVSDFEPHIANSGGIISTIAKRVGCGWVTARKFIDGSPTLTELYNDECESVLDMAESVLIKSIQGGDTQDAKWLLSKKGKQRGYGDSVEVTGKDGGPIYVVKWDEPTNDTD